MICICRQRLDGTFDIDYEDGEFEMKVPEELVRSKNSFGMSDFRVGAIIEGNFRGNGKWFRGTIQRVGIDGYYDVSYDDGATENNLPGRLIRLAESSAKELRSEYGILKERDKIEANYKGRGRWYPGVVQKSNSDGSFDIHYDDGEIELNVVRTMIRQLEESKLDGSLRNGTKGFAVGTIVEGNYKGKGRWFPGTIKVVSQNGKFDIFYDDGETETDVAIENVRIKALIGNGLEKGGKVEANYKGYGKWGSGIIKRVSLDGTFDIEYDDGETETNVPEVRVRLKGSNANGNFLMVGAKVEANYGSKGNWFEGTVKRARLDGNYDIEYINGEVEEKVSEDLIRARNIVAADSFKKKINELKKGTRVEVDYFRKGRWFPGVIGEIFPDGTYEIKYDDGEVEKNVIVASIRKIDEHYNSSKFSLRPSEVAKGKYHNGEKVACYWYRNAKYGTAKFNNSPQSAIILRFNSDLTYTVELDWSKEILDDVKEKYLKSWTEGSKEIEEMSKKEVAETQHDKWPSVVKMANYYIKNSPTNHVVPNIEVIEEKTFKSDLEKIQFIIGEKYAAEFNRIFDKHDRYNNKFVDLNGTVDGFEDLGGRISVSEVKDWINASRSNGDRVHYTMDLTQFVLAYANLFYPSEHTMKELAKQENAEELSKTLRLTADSKDLATFAQRLGKKQLRELEKTFDSFATKDNEVGVAKIFCRDILEAFLSMGRAITITRLLEWMNDADVKPLDKLSLADFVSVFAFFFTSGLSDGLKDESSAAAEYKLKTVAEIAIQVLQQEKWSGRIEQNVQLIARLCAGRTASVVGYITKIREAFESFDATNSGSVSIQNLAEIFKLSNISFDTLGSMIKNFAFRLKQQSRETFLLPEVFEFFGASIQEYGEGTLSVTEAFAMIRMHCNPTDIRLAADMMLLIIDNIINHPTDSKFWHVNVKSEVFHHSNNDL